MASRFHQRDARSSLFSTYDAQTRSRPSSAASSSSPAPRSSSRNQPYSTFQPNSGSPYGLAAQDGAASPSQSHLIAEPPTGGGFSAYPGSGGGGGGGGAGGDMGAGRRSGDGGVGFRPATPNRRGQYSSAVLDELESQNEDQVGEMAKRVRMLKDITVAIGDEIRDSTAFTEKMNDQFEGARNRLRGTMNRMLLMAKRTGVGWRVWLGFFAFLILLFVYVWLF